MFILIIKSTQRMIGPFPKQSDVLKYVKNDCWLAGLAPEAWDIVWLQKP